MTSFQIRSTGRAEDIRSLPFTVEDYHPSPLYYRSPEKETINIVAKEYI